MTTDSAARAGHGERATAGGGGLAGDIGRRLAAHRAQRGMRVAELAREVGVTPSLISQIERGMSRPSVSTLFGIAQALDVPVNAFFREPQPPAAVAAQPDGSAGSGGGAAPAAQATAGHPAGPGRQRPPVAVTQCAGAAGQ